MPPDRRVVSRPAPALIPHLTLPPVSTIPDDEIVGVQADAVRRFVDNGMRPWGGEAVPVARPATVLLWFVLVADAAVVVWLVAVRAGAAPCAGLPCRVVTLGGHPDLLLVLAASAVVALATSAAVTHGLTRAGPAPLAVMGVGAVAGVVALLGVAVLLVLVAGCVAFLAAVLVAAADRF